MKLWAIFHMFTCRLGCQIQQQQQKYGWVGQLYWWKKSDWAEIAGGFPISNDSVTCTLSYRIFDFFFLQESLQICLWTLLRTSTVSRSNTCQRNHCVFVLVTTQGHVVPVTFIFLSRFLKTFYNMTTSARFFSPVI